MALGTNIRFIVENYADACTLTADPPVIATMPVTNLQNSSRGRKMRTTELTSQDIKGTSGVLTALNGFVLYNTNLSGDTTLRLRLYSDDSWTTLVYDTGVVMAFTIKALGDLNWGVDPLGASVFVDFDNPFFQFWFDTVYARSWTLTVSNPGNPDGYWEASRVFLGPALIPTWNIDTQFERKWQDDSKQYRTGGGSLRTDVDPAGSYRVFKFTLDRLSEGESGKFLDFQRKIGLRKDFFVSIYPEQGGSKELNHAMLAKNSVINTMKNIDVNVAGELEFEIEET